VWWYRHPGIKRLDFSPGDEIPARRKNGQPKTLAEALTLLEGERARAVELEDAAKRAQTQEGILRNQLAALRNELTEERTSLATLRDELSDERKKQTETDLLWRKAEERADEMEASYNSLADDLAKAAEYTSELEEEVESDRRKAEEIRYDLEQEIKQLRRELDEQRPSKESVSAEQEELNRQFEELRIRFEENARSLMLRDGELTKQRQDFAASELAHREIHATADSIVRSLAEERNRRIAAERHVEELRQELRRVISTPPSLLGEAQRLALLDLHNSQLATELQEVRLHRDFAVEEQERLAARLLHLMSPGRYLEHAAAAGYDITTDPLIKLMQRSVIAEAQLAQWQKAHGTRQRARRWDLNQTLVEQAYAAAITKRWSHINQPNKSFKGTPYWVVTGILLDSESERHLLKVNAKRANALPSKMEQSEE
jgi:chromosome segregation ATPase